jgi:TRAP-type C4-dicarboxylate transport system substrate-binding protein
LAVLLAALATAALQAQNPPTLQLATMAPSGSIWERQLRTLAEAWQRTGAARIRIHAGGELGTEIEVADTIRSRRPTPQIAALSSVALSHIDNAFDVFSMPFVFDSYPELYAVMDALTPTLRQRLDDRGLVLLAWGHVGWANMFTTKPIQTIAELKELRVWTSGDEGMVRWFRQNGYRIEQSSLADLPIALQSGKIEAMPMSPLIASANQWYKQTPYMLDLGIAPIIGAVVIAKPTWEQFSEATRATFMKAAADMEEALEKAVPEQDRGTVTTLQSRKLLTVTKPQGPEWRTAGESLASAMSSGASEIYPAVLKARDAFRQKKHP